MSRDRAAKACWLSAGLFFVSLFVWMLTRPAENFFGNPEGGGSLEVHFGTPLSRAIYTYWPESGVEELNVSTGMWDRFKIEMFFLLKREGQIDLGDYQIRGREITGRVFWYESGRSMYERGILVEALPAKAEMALKEGRQKTRTHWPPELYSIFSVSGR